MSAVAIDDTDTGSPHPSAERIRAVLVAVSIGAIVLGVALRVWVALGPLGVLNADEVISLLMARDLLAGNVTAFYWGQAYGGTIEVLPLALAIGLLGDEAGAVAVPLIEAVVIGVLLWAIARRRLDPGFALAAVALYAVAPAMSVWFSTRPMGFYSPIVILGLGAVLLTEQLADPDRSRRDHLLRLAAIGLLLGVGWWTSAQIMFFAVPVAYALVRRRTVRSVAEVGAVLAGAVGGAAVWLAYNLRNDLQSLRELPPADGSTFDHVRAQIGRGWPMVVGARRPFDEQWLLPGGGWLLLPVAVAAVAAIAVAFWRHPRLRTPLAGVLLAFPVLQAMAPTGSFVGTGRYYYFVVPSLAYVVVAALSRLNPVRREAATIAVVVVAAIVTTLTLASMRDLQFGPEDPDELTAALRERNIADVYADYWIGYPLAWADDDLRVTTDHTDRNPEWAAAVRAASRVAYVFWLPYGADAQRFERLQPLLDEVGVRETFDVGGYRVIVPDRNVPPEGLSAAEPTG